MKIYTKTGDKGTSSLFSGERVPKSCAQMEAYGSLDELNANLALLVALLESCAPQLVAGVMGAQEHIFLICSWLASSPDSAKRQQLRQIPEAAVTDLEVGIDSLQEALPALQGFIMPAGTTATAQAHVARTVCRRAERRIVALLEIQDDPALGLPLQFVNRLADYLFALARAINHACGVAEVLAPNGRADS